MARQQAYGAPGPLESQAEAPDLTGLHPPQYTCTGKEGRGVGKRGGNPQLANQNGCWSRISRDNVAHAHGVNGGMAWSDGVTKCTCKQAE